jgi:SH3-like domain-containing protein
MTVLEKTRKKVFAVLMTGVACMLIASPTSAAEYVSVKKDNANIRTTPGTDAPVSMELFSGYPLKVDEKKGDWLKVSDFENDTGWIHSSMVNKNKNVIVSASKSANMRTTPDAKAPVVADVERGVVLSVVTVKGKWKQLKHSNGTIGWVHESMLWPPN